MAVDLTFGNSFTGVYGNLIKILFWFIAGCLFIGFVAFLGYLYKKRKMYNINVAIFIPRSSGMERHNAKGGYFKENGKTIFKLKRKGFGALPLPPPPSNYIMSPNRDLMLLQKGIDDFEPINPIGMRTVEVRTKSGKIRKYNVFQLRCVNHDATGWLIDYERDAERRFTILSFWAKHKDLIAIITYGTIFIVAGIIMWKGLEEVAAALFEVARELSRIAFNTPQVG